MRRAMRRRAVGAPGPGRGRDARPTGAGSMVVLAVVLVPGLSLSGRDFVAGTTRDELGVPQAVVLPLVKEVDR